jgi:hypothetical protein
MKISKQLATDIMYGDTNPDEIEIIWTELVDTTRWGTLHNVIFRIVEDDRHYRLTYETGSGDSDYTSADTDWGEMVEVVEVEQKPVTTYVWEKVG